MGDFSLEESKTFCKTCESIISLRSLLLRLSVAESGQLVQTLLEDKGRRTHSGDCISLIFSLASFGKKGWLAIANFLTADRTFLLGTH